jgi:uncharacterized membrane protein YgaE (UPF0421/DUF939 family)
MASVIRVAVVATVVATAAVVIAVVVESIVSLSAVGSVGESILVVVGAIEAVVVRLMPPHRVMFAQQCSEHLEKQLVSGTDAKFSINWQVRMSSRSIGTLPRNELC